MLAQFAGAFGGGDFRFTRLTILGTVRATAPPLEVDAPRLVELTADVLGDYDYESGLIAIDARLRDSKLGGVEFSGSLLIRIGTGNLPAFAISAGGFHPAFTDLPPAMPARLDRLALRWQVGSSVSFTLEAYVAITASSWQLGAALSIVAELGPVDLDGRVHFDAIAYDDGRFSVELGLYVRIRWRGHTLMSVEADIVLDRNELQVWHAAGEATFSVLWWDKTVDFEHTWGDERSLPPAPAVDAAALVRAALAEPASWSTQLPQGGEALVTLASVADHRRAGPSARHADRVAAGGSARAAPRPRRWPAGGAGDRRHDRCGPRGWCARSATGAGDGAVPTGAVPGPHRGRAADAEDVRVIARRRPHRATGPDEPGRERRHVRLRADQPGAAGRRRATATGSHHVPRRTPRLARGERSGRRLAAAPARPPRGGRRPTASSTCASHRSSSSITSTWRRRCR